MKTPTKVLDRFVKWKTAALAAAAVVILASTPALAWDDNDEFKFDLVSSAVFLPHAHGRVKIDSEGPIEIMSVTVCGLPPNTDFDFFVIQKPTAPFGLSWYQGDIETNRSASASRGSSGALILRPLSWRLERRAFPHRPLTPLPHSRMQARIL